MEPEGSLPRSQVSATRPYPEPTRSSPYPPHPTSWRSILILSSHLRLGLPSGLFPSGSPPKPCTHLSPPPYALHAPPISFSILSSAHCWVSSTDHTAPLNIVSSTPHLPLRPKYSPQHPIQKRPQPTILPQCQRRSFTPIQNNRQNYSSVYINL